MLRVRDIALKEITFERSMGLLRCDSSLRHGWCYGEKKRISTMSVRVIREPFPIVSVEKSSFKETYGGAEDIVMALC